MSEIAGYLLSFIAILGGGIEVFGRFSGGGRRGGL
jgi:hypothetical protein